MKAVEINKDICIGCGKCVKDCVGEKIKMVDGKAEFMFQRCIQCGHCFAICPVGAVKMTSYPDAKDETTFDISNFDSDDFLCSLKSRRTIRFFKDKDVDELFIEKIIEAGRYCPTGTNAQDFSFIVLRDKLPEAEAQAVKLFRNAKKFANPLSSYIKHTTIDDNFFFKGAPVAILVVSKGKTSACLASSYMELMAANLGLGVLYSGFFVAAAKLDRKIAGMLNLEKGESVVTCLVIGHPDVEYERIPPRNKAKVKRL